MTEPKNTTAKRRRTRGDHSVLWIESRQKYRARADLGYDLSGKRVTIERFGNSETAALKALKSALKTRQLGHTQKSSKYTVQEAVSDWFAFGIPGMDPQGKKDLKSLSDNHIVPLLGAAKVKDLTARDVEKWLKGRASRLSTRTLQKVLSVLRRALNRAVAHDLAVRNVTLVAVLPPGRAGRKSKSFNASQADAIIAHSMSLKMRAYVLLSMLTGIRTEEARALTWHDVVLETVGQTPAHIRVVRSVRASGDTKTRKSRRSVALPALVVAALQAWKAATKFSKPGDLVFCTDNGTAYDASGMRRRFRTAITGIDGINPAEWTPRELRHSFVSLMSDAGVPIEQIAHLVGHSSTAVTELVYRHQLREVVQVGAEAMDQRFGAENR